LRMQIHTEPPHKAQAYVHPCHAVCHLAHSAFNKEKATCAGVQTPEIVSVILRIIYPVTRVNLATLMPYRDNNSTSPICKVCYRPVDLETSNTDEDGEAIHEQCYLLKLHRTQVPSLSIVMRASGPGNK
jgi:hypothetical protein